MSQYIEKQFASSKAWLCQNLTQYPWLSGVLEKIEKYSLEIQNTTTVTNRIKYELLDFKVEVATEIFQLICKHGSILHSPDQKEMDSKQFLISNFCHWQINKKVQDNPAYFLNAPLGVFRCSSRVVFSDLFSSFKERFSAQLDHINGDQEYAMKEALIEYAKRKSESFHSNVIENENKELSNELLAMTGFEQQTIAEMAMRTSFARLIKLSNYDEDEYDNCWYSDSEIFEDSVFSHNINRVKNQLVHESKIVSLDYIYLGFKEGKIRYSVGEKLFSLLDPDFKPKSREFGETNNWKYLNTDGLKFSDIFLPDSVKAYISSLVRTHTAIALGPEKSSSLLFCFQGAPGTGKSMLAKIIANELGYELLRINTQNREIDYYRFLINKMKGRKVVLLFDECDELFMRNAFVGKDDAWAKVLFEDFKGVIVFTTNYQLSDAFLRRMTFVYNFNDQAPEDKVKILNREIEKVTQSLGIDQEPVRLEVSDFSVALQHGQLTGGYFKQAIQMAIAKSYNESNSLGFSKEDLLSSMEFVNNQVFENGEIKEEKNEILLEEVILEKDIRSSVERFINYVKKTDETTDIHAPVKSLLLYGPSGTGKTLLAQALAKEFNREIMITSGSNFLSSFVGGTERNIAHIFSECQNKKKVLFIDEVETLFGKREGASYSWQASAVNEFLVQIEKFKGILIVATNIKEQIDFAFSRRFLFKLQLNLPSPEIRQKIWLKYSSWAALSESDFVRLAEKYELSGGQIRNISYRMKAMGLTTIEEFVNDCEVEVSTALQSNKRIGI